MADGSADAVHEKCGRVSLKGRRGLIEKLSSRLLDGWLRHT